ncbi:MAG: hypothetical protein K2H76_02050 [Muribaculaceae bacterium]|nr:hypothetical protein [Muribaculaceae bacterium]
MENIFKDLISFFQNLIKDFPKGDKFEMGKGILGLIAALGMLATFLDFLKGIKSISPQQEGKGA